jgi:pimeloyl-ACP methyl ester carboxylesterase
MNAPTPPSTLLPGAELLSRANGFAARVAAQARNLMEVAGAQAAELSAPAFPALPAAAGLTPGALASDWGEYAVDAAQRAVLFWDTLRQAGNAFAEHEAAGCPPVLVFPYETVLDGRALPRPVNYALVRIVPPEGFPPTDAALRPFVIVDPRAGHGAGIGGFKSDSQVGVALRRRHPVYFVVFHRDPEPGQTILDITAAEGAFLRRVHGLHPAAPKPVVIGNCQGGWAAMMLGAQHPDTVGPLVLNGAPLSYWAGQKGRNPMRYTGGLAGGGWPAALLADLGNGRFDGANLVLNFESLSPANTWFRKYFDLYAKVDTEAERFLEFERWWGGFFLMNADEIRWIVSNLFIGDRFARGALAASGRGDVFDMKSVRSPVIVFASAGDNITPPGQALRWIADVYRDEQEIKTLGQTIIYLVHDQIGHLGIFVSGAVAKKEHTEIAGTLEVIEAVAPGLYELAITHDAGDGRNEPWHVELVERRMADIRALAGEAPNEAFPAVAKVSQLNEQAYDLVVRPLVRAATTEASAELRRRTHPLRLRRTLVSDRNPFLWPLGMWADMARRHRAPAAPGNAFVAMERAWADSVAKGIDAWREGLDMSTEFAFHAVYGNLAAFGVAGDDAPIERAQEDAEEAAEAAARALAGAERGGYAEAVIRMMVLLAQARGGVRRTRLARSNALLTTEEPFASMGAAERQAAIREQTLIATLQPARALETLAALLPTRAERERALAAVESVAGPEAELGEAARAMLARQREVLGLG